MVFAALALAMELAPAPVAQPFALSEVKVTGGPFAHAAKLCADYLLEVEPDRLLHSFRKHAGLTPKAEIYGGWENTGLAGHTLGHYLTACSQQFAATGDARYKAKVDYIIDELVACQTARPDGCISAIPNGDKAFAEIKEGKIRSGGFDLNGMWSPWYTHHKVFAGLLDADSLAKNPKALEVAKKFADWAINTTKGLSDEQWQQMLVCEYGGMNESLVELYARTKDGRFLDLAKKFYDRRVLDPLKDGKDVLQGRHSNTQIPKLVGLARIYEDTGDEKSKDAAEFFWETVVRNHTYSIGGNSNHEYLGPPKKLNDRLSSNTAETCNTYNMLRLTRHVFSWNPSAEAADYYERAYLNHILASQNSSTGMMTYFMPLGSGSLRRYSNKFRDFTCCHGSGLENHTKHGDSAYFHAGGKQLWVNLYMPTKLTWREAGAEIEQNTDFPYSGKVTLQVLKGAPREYEVLLRHPAWATKPFAILVNGKAFTQATKPSSYISLKRTWKAGDKIEFTLPMELRTESMPDNPKRVSLLYGPVVLAADIAPENQPSPRIPVLVTGEDPISSWLKPDPSQPLHFFTQGAGRPSELKFRPFFLTANTRYAVYFDRFDEAGWRALEAEYRAEEERQRDLEARTLDYVRIGEMQPERDHQLKSERNDVREANGRGFRTPLAGGWFEFTMKVDPQSPVDLVMTYWGSDRSEPEFEILVDGAKLVTETLPDRQPNRFFDQVRSIPAEMTNGKQQVTIKVQAIQGKAAAAVAGARTVRRAKS